MTIDPAAVADNIAAHRARLAAVGHPVTLVAVTKRFGIDAVLAAIRAGCVDLGENYAQELVDKSADPALESRPIWHMIGSVQRNKVRALAPVVGLWEAVDRVAVLDELVKRAATGDVLIQVNASGEEGKSGCRPEEVAGLLDHAAAIGCRVVGLMTMGVADDPVATAAAFARTRALVDDLGLTVCSMGMSGDLDIAIGEGTTMVRVGTGIFGARPT